MNDKILSRYWEEQDLPWRAVDLDGKTFYYKYRPSVSSDLVPFWRTIFPSSECVRGNDIDEDWAQENWKNSLQSFEDYKKLQETKASTPVSGYRFPSELFDDWIDVDDKYKWRAFDKNGDLFYYLEKPSIIGDAWSSIFGHVFTSCSPKKWASMIWMDSLEQRPAVGKYVFSGKYLPDWDDPETNGYNYRAIDADGWVCYYASKPVVDIDCSMWTVGKRSVDYIRVAKVSTRLSSVHWINSLEERPGIKPTRDEYLKIKQEEG